MTFFYRLLALCRKNVPLLMIVVGCVFIFLPSLFPDCKILYCLGVWIWPFCFLYYGRLSRHRFSQSILFIFLALGLNIRFYEVLGQGLEAESLLLMIFASCAFWVPFAWDVRYCRRESPFVYTLVFPVVYGTLNLILSACNVIPVCNLAYAQYDNKALLQIVSVVGEYGLTFLITWVASIAVYVCEHWRSLTGKRVAVATVSALVAIFSWGGLRIISAEDSLNYVRVAQATGPKLNQVKGEWEFLPFQRNLKSFDRIAKSARDKRAEMLVFSEEAFSIADTNEAFFVANAAARAKEYDFPILLALEVRDMDNSRGGRLTNKVVLIDRNGSVVSEYVKHNAVPVVETSEIEVGEGKIPTVSLEIGDNSYRVSFVICYDGNFTDDIRQMDPTTQLYFNPSWDWEAINDFHYRTIGLRSVENGVNLVMTTYDGFSLVSDPYGRELALTDINKVGYERVFITNVPTQSVETIYSRFGGTMNLVYPVASLFFIALGQRRRKDGAVEDECSDEDEVDDE